MFNNIVLGVTLAQRQIGLVIILFNFVLNGRKQKT